MADGSAPQIEQRPVPTALPMPATVPGVGLAVEAATATASAADDDSSAKVAAPRAMSPAEAAAAAATKVTPAVVLPSPGYSLPQGSRGLFCPSLRSRTGSRPPFLIRSPLGSLRDPPPGSRYPARSESSTLLPSFYGPLKPRTHGEVVRFRRLYRKWLLPRWPRRPKRRKRPGRSRLRPRRRRPRRRRWRRRRSQLLPP